MGWFLLYLFIALQVAACVIAIVARIWTISPEPIVWRGTDVDVAANNVERFFVDIDDSRFAYPTGMFMPDAESDPEAGRVVMREENFTGSRGFGWAFRVFVVFQMAWQREFQMGRRNPLFMVFAWFFFMWIAACLAMPFVIAAVLDVGYRIAFRSRITAAVTKHPVLEDAVNIQLEFRGLSAFGLVPDVLRGMAAPVLPAGLLATAATGSGADADTRTLAIVGGRAAAWAQSAEQRFRVIYGSAIGAAVLVALVLSLSINHGYNSSGEYYGNSGYESSAAEDTTSEDTTSEDTGSEDPSVGSSDTGSEKIDESTDDTTDESSVSDTAVQADGYTVEPPGDWVRDSISKDKGAFTESRWHLAGRPDVYVLVNHTASYTGSALDGATAVRAAVSKIPGYTEYRWSAVDDNTWEWRFAARGSRKIDRFIKGCDGGYAALGAAPQSEFAEYRSTLEAFVESLTPSCDGTSTAADDGDEDTTPPPAPAVNRNSPSRVLRRHFQRINAGDYDAAFELMSSSYRSKNAGWTQQPSAAEPYVNVVEVGPSSVSGSVASVYVKFYGRDRNPTAKSTTECRRFEGRARMVKENGKWRYDPSGNDYEVTEIDRSLDVCNP